MTLDLSALRHRNPSGIAKNFESERQFWPFLLIKAIATASVDATAKEFSLISKKNRWYTVTA